MRLHNGQRPYSCERCQLSFTQFVHLKLHARIHNNERPFTCAQCGRQYISPSGLRTHWKNTGCCSGAAAAAEEAAVKTNTADSKERFSNENLQKYMEMTTEAAATSEVFDKSSEEMNFIKLHNMDAGKSKKFVFKLNYRIR